MLHFIVLIFGFTGILGKLISLEAERLVFWRVFIGGGLVMLWLILRNKTVRFQPKTAAKVAFVGVCRGGPLDCFFCRHQSEQRVHRFGHACDHTIVCQFD